MGPSSLPSCVTNAPCDLPAPACPHCPRRTTLTRPSIRTFSCACMMRRPEEDKRIFCTSNGGQRPQPQNWAGRKGCWNMQSRPMRPLKTPFKSFAMDNEGVDLYDGLLRKKERTSTIGKRSRNCPSQLGRCGTQPARRQPARRPPARPPPAAAPMHGWK